MAKRNPERTEVCIVGAGASGAAAAKVLTERGVKVVALERGPWRTRETFGGDELANINRYNLWPDPLLNPRTVRTTADEPRARRAVLPGAADGRRRHGPLAGLAAALHPERLPPAHLGRRPAGHHAGRLAHHLRRARALLRPARMGVRRLRPGRCQRLRIAAQPRLSLPAAADVALRAEIPRGLQEPRLELVPDPASRPVAPAQRAPCDGDQRLRPTARRSHRHPLERAQRVRARRGQDRAVRPPAELLCPGAVGGWPGSGQGRRVPGRRRRRGRAAGRPVRAGLRSGRIGAAAAPVQVRPLPERARQRQRPGRAQRHLPRVQRRGRPLRRPYLRLGRRRLCQRQHVPVLRARRAPRLRQRRPHRRRRRRHPVADQLAPAGQPDLGRGGEHESTGTTSTTAWPSPWWSTTCRGTTTGSSSTTRWWTRGVCRWRGSR